MDGTRRAALALHSVASADRDWILGRLDMAERSSLEGMLAELQALGIPADAALADDRRSGAAAESPSSVVSREQASPEDRIAAATAGRVHAALEREADQVVAACFALRAWPWRAEALERWPRERRAKIAAALHARGELPERARSTLLAAFDARLALAGEPKRWDWRTLRSRWVRR